MKILLITSFFVIISITAIYSQKVYTLELKSLSNETLVKKLPHKNTFSSAAEREKELGKVLLSLHDQAYLAATFDSLILDTAKLVAYIDPGNIYKWANLDKGNVDEGLLAEIGFREKIYRKKPFSYKEVRKIQEKIIVYCENHGYPFASIHLDSIEISDNSISAQLNLRKEREVRIDSIRVTGNIKLTPAYLYNYIDIRPEDLYDESAVAKVSSRIKELTFIKETKPPVISFSEKHTKLILYLEKKRASQFDGFVGILPDNNTGKVIFTGDVRLNLQNSLGRGEAIDLNWRRLQANTQDLKARGVYPFLLSTPFGLDYTFKLYKKDTFFLELNQNIGLQYLLSGTSYFKVFYFNKKSTLLSTKSFQFQTTLPSFADVSSNLYGLGYKGEQLDYRFNPRKGYTFSINAGVGNRLIHKNPKLNAEIYKNLKLKTTQYSIDLDFSYFLPVKRRSTIKLSNQSAYLHSSSVFQNELFRIGGLKTLRGFDEESILASAYSIFTMEYRYLLEQHAYLYLFVEGAYYENKSIQVSVSDMPYSFGSGISFETKAGIFSINYALGKQFNNPIYLKSGKIHFGIYNYF